jgi:cytochrome oxidase Cu insertion factor (SCO1/SenC/PrrC family)
VVPLDEASPPAPGSFFTVLVAISRQRVGPGAIQVGATLPDFEATDEEGQPFRLSRLAGQPILLKFFRGHW